MSLLDPVGKIVKGPGLLPVKTRRPNQLLQFAQRDLAQAPPREKARLAEILQGQGRIPPGGILGEDSTPNHFPARSSRPPSLRPEAFQKCRVEAAENFTRRRLALLTRQVHIFKSYTRLPAKSRQARPIPSVLPLKKPTTLRKDAKAHRLANDNYFVFSAAPLRPCAFA